jgi:hypothetical protein
VNSCKCCGIIDTLEFQHRHERHGHWLADRLVVYDEIDADVRNLGCADYRLERRRDPRPMSGRLSAADILELHLVAGIELSRRPQRGEG